MRKDMTDWSVSASDDEQAGEGFYEPSDPKTIVDLYEKIAKEEVPAFEGTIYPRKELIVVQNVPAAPETPNKSENSTETKSPEKTEFDFDTQAEDTVKKFTPRRTPNRVQQKKVAKMSNVFSDIVKYKKLDEELTKDGTKESAGPQPQAS